MQTLRSLIAEDWDHKTNSWIGSVATQNQMKQQTVAQGNADIASQLWDNRIPFHRPCYVSLMFQWGYRLTTSCVWPVQGMIILGCARGDSLFENKELNPPGEPPVCDDSLPQKVSQACPYGSEACHNAGNWPIITANFARDWNSRKTLPEWWTNINGWLALFPLGFILSCMQSPSQGRLRRDITVHWTRQMLSIFSCTWQV